MKRTVFISILLFVLSLNVQGQTKLSPAQQKHVIEQIDKSVKSVSSIQCDFSQTKTMKMLKKTMTSNGVMYFKRDNKLRWQYTSPYDYVFIINGNQVVEPNIFYNTPKYEGYVEFPLTLGEGECFVLADSRRGGTDSRFFGPVNRDEIVGTVITILRRNNL